MKYLITGGLGFVGSAYAYHRLSHGDVVGVLDCQARGLSNDENARWLHSHPNQKNLKIWIGDVSEHSDIAGVIRRMGGVDAVLHAGAQSSVNLSIENPERDFESNVVGTFRVLEYLRKFAPTTKFVFMASNKVYDVTSWPALRRGDHYVWTSSRRSGPSEDYPFHTDAREPYGASKISGFYYTRCYAAMYGLRTVVCVPSGMAGERQFGQATQGWLGWMVVATVLGLPITIHGDGFQVRDMLHVKDVCSALDLMFEVADEYPGEVFNLGGGPRNAISLVEALALIQKYTGVEPKTQYVDWRPQDNKVYISNIEKLVKLGWVPTIPVEELIKRVCTWALSEKERLRALYA